MDRIPGNSLDPSDGRFAHAFDAQSRDFIKGGAPVLESTVRKGCRCSSRRSSRKSGTGIDDASPSWSCRTRGGQCFLQWIFSTASIAGLDS